MSLLFLQAPRTGNLQGLHDSSAFHLLADLLEQNTHVITLDLTAADIPEDGQCL
jgi:hypothetical protein